MMSHVYFEPLLGISSDGAAEPDEKFRRHYFSFSTFHNPQQLKQEATTSWSLKSTFKMNVEESLYPVASSSLEKDAK